MIRALLIVAIAACARAPVVAPVVTPVVTPVRPVTSAALVLGEFRLAKVVDGDTVKVDGLDSSLRLLGIDTEETFKSRADRLAFDAGWESYVAGKRGTARRPVKLATPMGEEAKRFAQQFFDGVERVRLERDHPAEIRDRYHRYLAYVFAWKHGAWVHYNVEAVRAGMSPYFPKYGRSRRFHAELVAAEAEAKAARRGIWAPGAQAYVDYPEREAWWRAREAFVETFRRQAEGEPAYVDLAHADAPERLERLVGREVTVLGVVGDVREAPIRVMFSQLPLVLPDRELLAATHLAESAGELAIVTGVPSIYEHPRTHARQVQIVIRRASQIRLSP